MSNLPFRAATVLLLGSAIGGMATAQAPNVSRSTPTAAGSPRESAASPATTSSGNMQAYLRHTWGVDDLEVAQTSSGELVRVSYHVLDATRAAPINDKAATPHLISEKTGYMLQIPSLEKVGQLRQTAKPIAGMRYWMVFANKGGLVQPGDRVALVIGRFRANGLVVAPSHLRAAK